MKRLIPSLSRLAACMLAVLILLMAAEPAEASAAKKGSSAMEEEPPYIPPTVYTSGDYSYIINDDGTITISGYDGDEEDIVIPTEIDGYAVSAIGMQAFTYKEMKSLTIPDTMTAVEPGALQFAGYLSEFRIAADHPVLSFENGVLYNKKEQRLVLYL